MGLRDTRRWFWSDPRSALVGLSCLRHAFFKVGRGRAGVVEHLFWRTLIHYRLVSPGLKGLGESAVPHALRPAGETYPRLAVTVIGKRGQALKGAWWMSWHREATKDVVACDKLREAGKRALIRRCPNEETQLGSHPVTPR